MSSPPSSQTVRRRRPSSSNEGGSGKVLTARTSHKVVHNKLVELVLNRPPQGSTHEEFEVVAEVGFGVSRIKDGKFVADVGLNAVKLLYAAEHCRPKVNSRYGARTEVPGVAVEAAQWIFTGPRNEEGVLRGSPAGLYALMSMEREGDGLPTVNISLQCDSRSDFRVLFRNTSRRMPLLTEKIIARFLQKCCADQDGDTVLASASITWK